MLIASDRLTSFATEIFTAAGANDADALEAAEHLVLANMKGHDSHGVGMIPAYVNNINNGNLDPTAHAEVVRDKGGVLLVDGCKGFGQVVGREATHLGIERAQQTAIACVGLKNAHHLGRIGTYGEICGAAGMVSLHLVNVVGHTPLVAPFGGREGRMQTNPFCCTVPRDNDTPIVLDMATSAIAAGKVRVAYMKGEPVVDGALVDHLGRPTNEPKVIFEEPRGALGPFGQHKGYGLALMCELLGGGLVGEWTMQPNNERGGTIINNMLMFILDPDAFGGHKAFQDEIRSMVEYLHETPAGETFDRVRIPGEPELESFAERSANGIPIDDNSWQTILAAAASAGLTAQAIQSLIAA